MQLPNLQFIRSIPVWGPRLYEAFQAVQQQTTRIETQGNLNATGDPPVPPPPDALKVTNGPSGEYQIAITHNGEFNRGTTFHVQWDTSAHFTNPHNIDLGASRNDSSLYLPGQTAHFRASTASPNGANSAWTYHGTQNRPTPVVGGVRGVRAPGMGSGTGAPGDQSGGPGPIQSRNSESGYNYKAQQRTAGTGFGASAQGSPAGVGASAGLSGGGGGGGGSTIPLNTKGDILTDSGTGLVRLGVGTNGEVLTANSVAADGLDWEPPIALTTTGSSGVAALTPGNPYSLNVPNYTGTGGPPTGPAGGDLGGTYPNPTVTKASGDFPVTGNIEAVTAGKGLQIKGGSNARIGSGTLVGGTLAVANTSVTANTKIFVQDTGGGVTANIGALYVASKTPSTGFTVTSVNPLDTSNFDYFLIEAI